MNLIQWKSRDLDRTLGLDPFFGRFFELLGEGPGTGSFTPAMDLVEEKDRFIATVDLPGVDPKNVQIDLQGDMLSIRGERKEKNEQREGAFLRREHTHGSFVRTVQLPMRVDASAVKATYEHGVLRVELPKVAEAIGRRITVDVK